MGCEQRLAKANVRISSNKIMSSQALLSSEDISGSLTAYEMKHAPEALYCEGDVSLLKKGMRVSVVGSRKPTPAGTARARAVTRELVSQNVIVVSGLAQGIDTIAHETAIEAGGRTIAVLGTPLDKIYPKSNDKLYSTIKTNHLAVSQFPSGYPFRGENFPRRNRTMAFISDATVIIEASEKSGTRHQGWEALRIGRSLFILQSVFDNPNLSWPREMVKYGALVINRANLSEAVEELPQYTGDAEFAF